MSAEVFHFPQGVVPPTVAATPPASTAAGPMFGIGDVVKLAIAPELVGQVVSVDTGLIQRGQFIVVVWRYSVLFGKFRMVGFLVEELSLARKA